METLPDHVREKLHQERWIEPPPSQEGRDEPGVVVCFANTYEVAMSNLGFQYVWSTCLDAMQVRVERLFFEPEHPGPPCAFTTRRPLSEHRLSLWSISFEEDYFHLAKMLDAAGVPLRASERGEGDPFILVGGPAVSANPETVAPLCDAIVLGDGEPFLEEAMETMEAFARGELSRAAFADRLSRMEGVYLPDTNPEVVLHDPSASARPPAQFRVVRTRPAPVRDGIIHSRVVTPHSVFRNVLMAELTRGCGRGCRFCLSGYWYRPVRNADAETLLEGVRAWGLPEEVSVGLVGASLVDHPELDRLTTALAREGIAYTTSSLRLEKLDTARIDRIVGGGMRTITIAPEAGTDRLRRVIRKTMTREEILVAIGRLTDKRVERIKLYFMLGLPTEEDADVEAIAHLVREFKAIFRERGHHPRLSLSVNALVPKPWTAFQWKGMIDAATHRRRSKSLYRALDPLSGVHVKAEGIRATFRQSVLSLGDRRVGEALILWGRGEAPTWKRALKQAAVDTDWIVHGEKPDDYRFPWDFVQAGVSRSHLLKEFHRSFQDGGEVGRRAWEQRQRALSGNPES